MRSCVDCYRNLVAARESVQEIARFFFCHSFEQMVCEWERILIFDCSNVHLFKIDKNLDFAIIFRTHYNGKNPFYVLNVIDEFCFFDVIYLVLDSFEKSFIICAWPLFARFGVHYQ